MVGVGLQTSRELAVSTLPRLRMALPHENYEGTTANSEPTR